MADRSAALAEAIALRVAELSSEKYDAMLQQLSLLQTTNTQLLSMITLMNKKEAPAATSRRAASSSKSAASSGLDASKVHNCQHYFRYMYAMHAEFREILLTAPPPEIGLTALQIQAVVKSCEDKPEGEKRLLAEAGAIWKLFSPAAKDVYRTQCADFIRRRDSSAAQPPLAAEAFGAAAASPAAAAAPAAATGGATAAAPEAAAAEMGQDAVDALLAELPGMQQPSY